MCALSIGTKVIHRPWMTLNGRYALDCRKGASFEAQYKNFNEDRPIAYTLSGKMGDEPE